MSFFQEGSIALRNIIEREKERKNRKKHHILSIRMLKESNQEKEKFGLLKEQTLINPQQ